MMTDIPQEIPDDDEDWEWVEESEFEEGEVMEEGPSGPPLPRYTPVFTGVLDANGRPIIKHPVVMRCGFHTEERKYYCPTKENEEHDGIVGWFYETMTNAGT